MKPTSLRLTAVATLAALSLAANPLLPASASVGDTAPVEETDVPIVVTAPYPPDIVSATASSGGAALQWSPPADNGGSP